MGICSNTRICPTWSTIWVLQIYSNHWQIPLADAPSSCTLHGWDSGRRWYGTQMVSIMITYVSLVLFLSSPIHSFQNQLYSLKTLYLQSHTASISGFCRTMHKFLKNWRARFRWNTKTKYDGCGPDMQNRAAGSEETPLWATQVRLLTTLVHRRPPASDWRPGILAGRS